MPHLTNSLLSEICRISCRPHTEGRDGTMSNKRHPGCPSRLHGSGESSINISITHACYSVRPTQGSSLSRNYLCTCATGVASNLRSLEMVTHTTWSASGPTSYLLFILLQVIRSLNVLNLLVCNCSAQLLNWLKINRNWFISDTVACREA